MHIVARLSRRLLDIRDPCPRGLRKASTPTAESRAELNAARQRARCVESFEPLLQVNSRAVDTGGQRLICRPTRKVLMKGPRTVRNAFVHSSNCVVCRALFSEKERIPTLSRAGLFAPSLLPSTKVCALQRADSCRLLSMIGSTCPRPTSASTFIQNFYLFFLSSFCLGLFRTTANADSLHSSRSLLQEGLLFPCENGVPQRHPLGCRHLRHWPAAVAACLVSSPPNLPDVSVYLSD